VGFFQHLEARSRDIDSLVCVGLDPDFRRHRVEDIAEFNRRIIEATAPFAACYKPNIAFYEQFGIAGLRALEQTLAVIPSGIPVIGDVKRGDMGSSSEAYARAMFEQWGFGAVTVNGYQGLDAITPFLAYEDRAVLILCRTSNPSSSEFQEQRLENGRLLYQQVALTAAAGKRPSALPAGGAYRDVVVAQRRARGWCDGTNRARRRTAPGAGDAVADSGNRRPGRSTGRRRAQRRLRARPDGGQRQQVDPLRWGRNRLRRCGGQRGARTARRVARCRGHTRLT